MFKALELEHTDPQPVDITRGSLNKGRIEFWVESQKSVEFRRETIPTISPNTEEEKTHKYMFLGPGEHITRFVNAWVPRDFAKPGKIDKLGAVIRMQNAALRTITETDTGQTRPSIIRVAKLVDSTKMMMPGGHVLITLELEEDLWTPLVEMRGRIKFSTDWITLTDRSLTDAIRAAETAAQAETVAEMARETARAAVEEADKAQSAIRTGFIPQTGEKYPPDNLDVSLEETSIEEVSKTN